MTTIKEAIKRWEAANGRPIKDELEVGFQFQMPPIEKLDSNLAQLEKVEKLYLSTNLLEKLQGLPRLKNLKVLSIARCKILTLSGIEHVHETLEELWASYNMIVKLGPLASCKQLRILYLNYNYVREWPEVAKLSDHPYLKDVAFIENPISRNMDKESWQLRIIKTLPKVNRLDGEFIATTADNEEKESKEMAKSMKNIADPSVSHASVPQPPPPPPPPPSETTVAPTTSNPIIQQN